jgi:undecaprenyl-diphosphatase
MEGSGMSVGRLQRDPRTGWSAFALAAFGALGMFILVALLAVVWPLFVQPDIALSAAVRATRNPALTQVAGAFTTLGSAFVAVPVTLALMAWMAFRRNWAAVVYVFMTIGVGWFLGDQVIKRIIARPRPSGVNIAPMPGDFSMPSGHSLAAFLMFTTICVVVMLNLPAGNHMKRWLAIASAALIVAVGFSRVYLGVHWVGDVIAAWLLGAAWWGFTTTTYFGSVTEEKRVMPHPGASATPSE